MAESTKIRLALDWTPNTLHTGLYIASHLSYYASSNPPISIDFIPPSPPYTTTPARLVAEGKADLAICPSESCLAYAENGKLALQAIYAISQEDASAIVSVKPEFASLKALEKGRYGSYNARYEDAIVRAMVSHAGGDGGAMQVDAAKEKLNLFDEVKKGAVDATWVFMPWEGVEAEMEGTKLNVFRPGDYGVPYGYSPVLTRDAKGPLSEEVLKAFVRETARGYEYARQHPEEAAEIMKGYVGGKDGNFLLRSQENINKYYTSGTGTSLGRMDPNKWQAWVAWLKQGGLLKSEAVDVDGLFTNKYFE